jgi:hypothetical protein
MKESTKDTLALSATIVPISMFVGACVLCPSLLVPTSFLAVISFIGYVFLFNT